MPSFHKFIFLLSLSTSSVFAATQGSLSTTSSGTVGISITIPSLVQISGLSDIALGSTSTFPATGSTTACIYSNIASPSGSYFVTATSTHALAGSFRVNDGSSNNIVYSAYWNNASVASQTTALVSGIKTAQQTGGSATSVTCGGTPNANFNLSFSAAQVAGAPAAAYTDTVTILITPT